MTDPGRLERRIHNCARCGRRMFEYFGSPDGHYGLATVHGEDLSDAARKGGEIRCPTCGARYRLLERLDALGRPAVRV